MFFCSAARILCPASSAKGSKRPNPVWTSGSHDRVGVQRLASNARRSQRRSNDDHQAPQACCARYAPSHQARCASAAAEEIGNTVCKHHPAFRAEKHLPPFDQRAFFCHLEAVAMAKHLERGKRQVKRQVTSWLPSSLLQQCLNKRAVEPAVQRADSRPVICTRCSADGTAPVMPFCSRPCRALTHPLSPQIPTPCKHRCFEGS